MKQRVVVLGAGGFIGRSVVGALQATDWATPVAAGHRAVAAPGSVERVRVDATDEAALAGVLQGASGVVNCVAGEADTIIANARALFSAASHCTPPPRVVYLSSMAIYGASTGTIAESAPLIANLGAYSAAKIAAEHLAADYDRVVILRPGIVYGPCSPWWSGHIARLLLQGRLGNLGSDGNGLCNLLYVHDMATAVLRALRTPGIEGLRFNVAMSAPPTWNEYFALYAKALGIASLQHIPAWRLTMELRLLGPLLRCIEVVAGRARWPVRLPPPIRPWLIELTRRKIALDTGAVEQSLAMKWTPIEQALATTAAWFLGTVGAR